jgi:heme O synthase-like polyprenyltransferase
MSGYTSNSRIILITSLILSVLVISLFLKILKGIFLLVALAIVVPVMYWLLKAFWNNRKRSPTSSKLKERA